MTPADAMLSGILREREALRRAHRLELEAIWREAGDAIQGGPSQESTPTGGCGCSGCADGAARGRCGCQACADSAGERDSGHGRRTLGSSRRVVNEVVDRGVVPEGHAFPEECVDDCYSRGGSFEEMAACIQECAEEAWEWEDAEEQERDCPNSSPPYFKLPKFSNIAPHTQKCFVSQYGIADWPSTDCCPPPIHQTDSCEPPSMQDWLPLLTSIEVHILSKNDGIEDFVINKNPTGYDLQMIGAAIFVLISNIDIVIWSACLVETWSPEASGLEIANRLQFLLSKNSKNKFNFNFTFVDTIKTLGSNGEIVQKKPPATMWAFTYRDLQFHPNANDGHIGVIIPIGETSTRWETIKTNWKSGGSMGLCSAVQVASQILHELVHITGDHYNNHVEDNFHERPGKIDYPGTLHDSDRDSVHSCWDEARMIQSIFMWAMAKRYTCIKDNQRCCKNMNQTKFFANTPSSAYQLMSKCEDHKKDKEDDK